MQNILKEQLCLQNDLLCNSQFFHVRCSAHILNLIVQDELKVIGDSFYKIRESVRWNSAYKMLDTAIKYKRSFSSLQLLDTNYKHCPSHEEWVRVEKICDFLMPFNEITKLFSGSTYPTSNLYFRQVWKIEFLLRMNMKNGDPVIKEMACRMKIKFDKYWEQYSFILAMEVVLDPRMKFKLLEFCYKKLDESTYKEKLYVVKNKLYMLFEAYKATSLTATTSSTASTSRCENVIASDDFDFIEYCVQDNVQNGKSVLDVYLDEPHMDMKSYASLDILNFWKDKKHRFGDDGEVEDVPIRVPTESSGA
ncbi:zinc finger BED domain-containing protein RICESLEEPER 2-like [Ipomoea triloba]|uniref:zinc finger BED domain-containing protein RICESLEEPER 2-like n=1 Tax=Ipomoea triloba TaxID=35885 RepID=UPI00125DED24|nr:zinc finger BED domain-containing protein RICESLEEPER 2-like [Ipomoea triloba]